MTTVSMPQTMKVDRKEDLAETATLNKKSAAVQSRILSPKMFLEGYF